MTGVDDMTTLSGQPASPDSLRDARKQLTWMADAHEGPTPAWMVAARLAVEDALEERDGE